ncbi:hypothetical protein V8E36_007690 [Tilletia maclaganii]
MSTLYPVPGTNVTVSSLPYDALIIDVANKCNKRGINHELWKGDGSCKLDRTKPGLLLISLNKVVSRPFQSWAATNKHRIGQIIMDEAHCVKKVPLLVNTLKDKRWILMTGTLPPCREKDLADLTLLLFVWRRDLTHRDNLAFSHRRYGNRKDLLVELKRYIRSLDSHTVLSDARTGRNWTSLSSSQQGKMRCQRRTA